mgnify:CR=1 FL=1
MTFTQWPWPWKSFPDDFSELVRDIVLVLHIHIKDTPEVCLLMVRMTLTLWPSHSDLDLGNCFCMISQNWWYCFGIAHTYKGYPRGVHFHGKNDHDLMTFTQWPWPSKLFPDDFSELVRDTVFILHIHIKDTPEMCLLRVRMTLTLWPSHSDLDLRNHFRMISQNW